MNPLNPLTNPRTAADALALDAAAMQATASTPTRLKRLQVKIFRPGNDDFLRVVFVAKRAHVFTEEGIDERLNAAADLAESRFPGHDYRVAQIAPGAYNFVHCDECKGCAKAAERAA